MTFSALIYRVTINKSGSPKNLEPFGNYDGSGQWLGDRIKTALTRAAPAANNQRTLSCRYEGPIGDAKSLTVGATFIASLTGQRSMDNIAAVGHPVARIETDSADFRLAVLFKLKKNSTDGRLAVVSLRGHTPLREMNAALNHLVSGYVFNMRPLIDRDAFKTAVKSQHVEEVTFHARRKSASSFSTLGSAQGLIDVTTKLKPVGRTSRLVWDGLTGFVDGGAVPEIEYDGIKYDEARVTVTQGAGRNARSRTYALTDTDRGRALAEVIEMSNAAVDDHGYTSAALFDALLGAIDANP